MSSLAQILGKNIRETRKAKGFSQESLALQAKIDRSYMGRIERGEANISVDLLYKLSEVIKVNPHDLLP